MKKILNKAFLILERRKIKIINPFYLVAILEQAKTKEMTINNWHKSNTK